MQQKLNNHFAHTCNPQNCGVYLNGVCVTPGGLHRFLNVLETWTIRRNISQSTIIKTFYLFTPKKSLSFSLKTFLEFLPFLSLPFYWTFFEIIRPLCFLIIIKKEKKKKKGH